MGDATGCTCDHVYHHSGPVLPHKPGCPLATSVAPERPQSRRWSFVIEGEWESLGLLSEEAVRYGLGNLFHSGFKIHKLEVNEESA